MESLSTARLRPWKTMKSLSLIFRCKSLRCLRFGTHGSERSIERPPVDKSEEMERTP
ncbi:hypothetical protein SAMN02745157_1933 [Kaistia soli DSM 19436]|uniref:Uncharacterized protein n=1 Tax=Kaistia soli DSM 19436 TaxID=1122133 RepID=A0A1M4ZUZ3_9HYPH|nr:hypothetical protein SAMN02745157_1933 [Kaistia soli DSM 19436]